MAAISILKIGLTSAVLLGVLASGWGLVTGQAPQVAAKAEQEKKVVVAQDKKAVPEAALPPLVDGLGDPLPPGAFLRLGTQRLRHGSPVFSVAWSPDGKWLASGGGGADPSIRLWDGATGKEIRHIRENQGTVRQVAISPEGTVMASLSDFGRGTMLILWEPATGKVLRELVSINNAAIGFAANGKALASIDKQGRACLLATATLEVLKVFDANLGKEESLTGVTLSGDATTLAAADSVGKIRLFEAVTGKLRFTLERPGKVECMCFTPDGKVLATAGKEQTIDLWDATSGKMTRRLEGHMGIVTALSWSPDAKLLVSGSGDKTARVWDVEKGTEVSKFSGHQARLSSVAFSPDGKRVASAGSGQENKVYLWDANTGKEVVADDDHVGRLAAMAVIGGGKMLLTSGQDPLIRLWDLQSGKRVGQVSAPHQRPKAIDVSPNGKLLAAGDDQGTIRLFNLPDGKIVKQFQAEKARLISVGLSPDGKWLVSSAANNKTLLWDIATGKVVQALRHPPEQMFAFAFSPDSRLLCTGGGAGVLRVWDVATGRELRQAPINDRIVIDRLVFSRDGTFLVSAHHDATIRVWNVATLKQIRLMEEDGLGVSVDLSPDGRMLATGGGDRIVRLWELATGKQRALFEGHRGAVMSVAFLPDGKTLISGSEDSTGLCWDLTGGGRSKPQPSKALTAMEVEAEWQHLQGQDVARAYKALLTLAANPRQALAKLQKELQPAPRLDPKLIAQWIEGMNDAKFAVREKALAELKKVGEAAWPQLRKVFDNPPSLEAQERVRLLLGNHQDDPFLPVPDRLRVMRALELLERLGTAGARDLAQTLADGAPEAWLTQEAKAMLHRMMAQG